MYILYDIYGIFYYMLCIILFIIFVKECHIFFIALHF